MFEYDELASRAAEVLDKYNFEEDIIQCRKAKWLDPYNIREHISFEHKGEVEEALDDLSLDEVMEYLTTRYGIRWEEIISYRMIQENLNETTS